MRVPLSWLSEYVTITLPVQELAQRLTMAGIEVGAIDEIGAGWDHIYTARIERIEPHPDADRLTLVTCDYGREAPLRVVTGATNVREGDIVPLALAGARLYSPKSGKVETLKPGKIRGIVSEGMICAEDELQLGDDHEGIKILDPDTPVGLPLREVLGDTILDLEVTPNRPDCLSVIGVAREVAALTGQRLRYPDVQVHESGPPAADLVRVTIDDPDLCPRYTAVVIRGVRIDASPLWLQERLIRAGLRPINNIVDVTNYVMLEYGQPLHAFDMDRVAERHIIVRRAGNDLALTTLDGQQRELAPDMLLIADPHGPIALAGVMGGLESEVSEATTNVLLESANFDPISIRRTARALRLPSEASRRFERGLSPEQTLLAATRAAQLMQQIAGGEIAPGAADAYPRPVDPVVVHLPGGEIPRLLGIPFERERVTDVFEALEMEVEPARDGLDVTVPYWRLDVRLPADLVEEYARISGYEQIPAAEIDGPIPTPESNPLRSLEKAAKRVLVGAGYSEIITYSLTSEARTRRLLPPRLPGGAGAAEAAEPDGGERRLPAVMDYRLIVAGAEPIKVLNPLSEEMSQLRVTTMGAMLETLAANLRHEPVGVQLFELGRIYLPRLNDLPDERRDQTIATGAYKPGRGLNERVEGDFFDLKGALEALLDHLDIANRDWQPVTHPSFGPGRAAALGVAPGGRGLVTEPAPDFEIVGVLGEVRREVREQFEIDEPVWLAYVDFDALARYAGSRRSFVPIPRFPPTLQDLSVIVDEATPVGAMERVMRAAGGRLLRSVTPIDVYRGGSIPPGKKSVTFRLTYQADDRTLTDAEVQRIQGSVTRALVREVGAEPRA